MQAIILLTAIWTSLSVPGDKRSTRIYLNNVMEQTTKGKASFYKEPTGLEGDVYAARIYTMQGVLKAEGHYLDPELKVAHGHFRFYYPDGRVESEGDYAQGNKSGVWQRFDTWGQQLAEKVYNPEPLANIIYTVAPTMPQYPGGERAMVSYLRSNGVGIKGAMASFVVEKNGDLSEIKVTGAQPELADQLVQALEKAPAFSAGEKDGIPVRVQMRVPLP